MRDGRNNALFWQGHKFTSEYGEKLCLSRGMKRGPLGLHVVNELSDSLGCLLVGYAGQKASVVLDLPVEFKHLSHIAISDSRRTALFA